MSKVYKVIYAENPEERWEVHFDDQRVGYQSWNQQVALSFAKDAAKKTRPSLIVVHDKEGKEQKTIEYPSEGKLIEKKINEK